MTAASAIELGLDREAAAKARAFIDLRVCPVHGSAVVDDAVLLASELVTNAAIHGGPPIRLVVDCVGSGLEVRVRDGSPDLPQLKEPDLFDEGGRGLLLVQQLSDDWGTVAITPSVKEVWFRLDNP